MGAGNQNGYIHSHISHFVVQCFEHLSKNMIFVFFASLDYLLMLICQLIKVHTSISTFCSFNFKVFDSNWVCQVLIRLYLSIMRLLWVFCCGFEHWRKGARFHWRKGVGKPMKWKVETNICSCEGAEATGDNGAALAAVSIQ